MNLQIAYPWSISLAAAIIYGAMLAGLYLRGRLSGPLERRFALYLSVVMLVSLANAASYGNWAYGEIRVLALKVHLYAQAALPLFLYVFLRTFIRFEEKSRAWMAGVVLLAALFTVDLANISLVTVFASLSEATIALVLRTFLFAFFTGLTIILGLREYLRSFSPLNRNRLSYLPLALPFLIGDYALDLLVGPAARPLAEMLHFVGVLILAYATLRHDLVDLSERIRQAVHSLALAMITIIIYAAVIGAVFVVSRSADVAAGLVAVVIVSVGLALFYQPLRDVIQGEIEAGLIGRRYDVREIVQQFSQHLNRQIGLDQRVMEGCALLKRAVGAREAVLLFVSPHPPFYTLRPIPHTEQLPDTLQLSASSSIIKTLLGGNGSLLQYDIDRLPKYADLSDETRARLHQLEAEVYIPILSRGELLGIWAIGVKASGGRYTPSDLTLLSTLADQSAAALENARLFADLSGQMLEINSMRDYLNATLASIGSGIITLDRESKIVNMNSAAESILGINAADAIGRPYDHVLPALDGAQLPLLLTRLWAQSAQHLVRDAIAHIPERGEVHLTLHLSAMRQGEEMLGVAIVIEDLTEQARLETERRVQGEETKRVRDMFQQYVAPTVVERLLSDPRHVTLGGERQVITVMFADIHGFTYLSEQMPPEELVDVLNGYLSLAAQVVFRYEGTLDKFLGDGVMAIFNAPLPQQDHAMRAAGAALALRREVAAYAAKLSEPLRLSFRIGFHTGEAVVGNIGARSIMNYTAVGDAVNIAKRLQENADSGQILLSQSTRDLLNGQVSLRERGEIVVKGRTAPIQIFELLDLQEEGAQDS